jgi:hypothetical protein
MTSLAKLTETKFGFLLMQINRSADVTYPVLYSLGSSAGYVDGINSK